MRFWKVESLRMEKFSNVKEFTTDIKSFDIEVNLRVSSDQEGMQKQITASLMDQLRSAGFTENGSIDSQFTKNEDGYLCCKFHVPFSLHDNKSYLVMGIDTVVRPINDALRFEQEGSLYDCIEECFSNALGYPVKVKLFMSEDTVIGYNDEDAIYIPYRERCYVTED